MNYRITDTVFSFCFIILLLWGCSSDFDKSDSKVAVIDVNADLVKDTLFYKNSFSAIDIIPLETLPEALMAQVSNLISFDSKFYICDNCSQGVYVYSDNGKFLRRIGAKGRDPGGGISPSGQYRFGGEASNIVSEFGDSAQVDEIQS